MTKTECETKILKKLDEIVEIWRQYEERYALMKKEGKM